MSVRPNIVLVHGAWADGSSWSAVIERLQADGYNVTAPQFPESSLAADVARLRQVLARQDGPTIVAGHSYGGQIITALGTDAPNVVGLVYIAAFGLDEGESIGGLLAQGPPDPGPGAPGHRRAGLRLAARGRLREPLRGRRRPGQGAGHVCRAAAAGLRPPSQEVMGVPAWKSQPSLVPGRRRRSGHPARCRAPVRRPHGRHHRRDRRRTTWRWSPTPMTCCSSSRPLPRLSRPRIKRLGGRT